MAVFEYVRWHEPRPKGCLLVSFGRGFPSTLTAKSGVPLLVWVNDLDLLSSFAGQLGFQVLCRQQAVSVCLSKGTPSGRLPSSFALK